MNYRITGGVGFVGSDIVDERVRLGQEVVALDDHRQVLDEILEQRLYSN
jgi:nucleoside-diphosphate-sugar epimerase